MNAVLVTLFGNAIFVAMSQLGPKERSATSKTESKQLKSMKHFIARTQAKVDAKLTQSRLPPTLSPLKYKNDPLHPRLDLSPSRGGQSSNVTSDHELEEVAKELFPPDGETGNAAKEKGAQEQPVKPLTPPTGAENILDAEPEDTHKNTEGNHSCDANELEQQEAYHQDPCGDAAMDNGATSDDNTRKISKDESYNSLLAPREEQSTPSIILSPDGTHEKTGEGEDPSSNEENGNVERPLFNPSLNPDGVFAKFLVKLKGDINAHDQQALQGETCANATLGIDTNQLVTEEFHKRIIYNQVRPTIDLCASDLCSFSTALIAPATMPTQQSDMIFFWYLKDIFHHHPKFYIFPRPQDYYNTKYKYGNTWTEWAHAIKEALQEAFESGIVYEGSFILPGMEDNLSAETRFMNPLNPGMISLAPWVRGVDRLSDANTYNPSPNPDGFVQLNLLDAPQYPYFHLQLSTGHKHHAHIRYGNIMHPHAFLQWAINKVDSSVQVAAVRTTLRFGIARHLPPKHGPIFKRAIKKIKGRTRRV